MLKLKVYSTSCRTLEIDTANNTYIDKRLDKSNLGKGYTIISIITYWELKKELKRKKFKRIKENWINGKEIWDNF